MLTTVNGGQQTPRCKGRFASVKRRASLICARRRPARMIIEMTADELIAALGATPLPGGAFALPDLTIAEIQRRAGGGEADNRSGDVLLLKIPSTMATRSSLVAPVQTVSSKRGNWC